MSVDAPTTVEETPVTAIPETSELKKAAIAAPETDKPADAAVTTDDAAKETFHDQVQNPGEAVVEATPASEGVLGYKEPGLLKMLKGYQKHHFWFGTEAVKSESLANYVRSGKSDSAHHNASWAQETGKGVLFFSKREEDKATPAGMIMLSEISKITKEGETEFQFKEDHHYHKFQAPTSAERDSWLVALEKEAEEAAAMKEGIVGSEGYKKNLDSYKPTPAVLAAVPAVDSKKSADAVATDGTTDAVAPVVADEDKKDLTSRSRSRGNRKSFFGGLLDKKEKAEESKEVKKEEKAEKKEEKKEIKEEKKQEAVEKKEEAKATHDASKAKEAAEAAAVAAVPAAAIVAEKKHEEKEEKSTPTDKKSKRNSVFGGIFAKKNVTSPDAEKTEAEAAPAVPAKDSEIPPVSETAPVIEKPVHQAPLDTAAVVAPVDTVETPAAVEEPISKAKPTTPTEATSAVKQPKEGGGFLGFIKKTESKLAGKKEAKAEAKEDKATEEVAKDPVAAAAVEPTTTETPAAVSEDRPVNPQRRSSLMERFGAQKKKLAKSSETDAAPTEVKREKSPLPSKVAGLFRKPSKAVKTTEEKTAETNGLTNGHSEPAAIAEATEAETKPTVTVPEAGESAIVGDVVPEDLHATVHDQVTAVPEVKASA